MPPPAPPRAMRIVRARSAPQGAFAAVAAPIQQPLTARTSKNCSRSPQPVGMGMAPRAPPPTVGVGRRRATPQRASAVCAAPCEPPPTVAVAKHFSGSPPPVGVYPCLFLWNDRLRPLEGCEPRPREFVPSAWRHSYHHLQSERPPAPQAGRMGVLQLLRRPFHWRLQAPPIPLLPCRRQERHPGGHSIFLRSEASLQERVR